MEVVAAPAVAAAAMDAEKRFNFVIMQRDSNIWDQAQKGKSSFPFCF